MAVVEPLRGRVVDTSVTCGRLPGPQRPARDKGSGGRNRVRRPASRRLAQLARSVAGRSGRTQVGTPAGGMHWPCSRSKPAAVLFDLRDEIDIPPRERPAWNETRRAAMAALPGCSPVRGRLRPLRAREGRTSRPRLPRPGVEAVPATEEHRRSRTPATAGTATSWSTRPGRERPDPGAADRRLVGEGRGAAAALPRR